MSGINKFARSLKFTWRGFVRDMLRGIPARLVFYPRIKNNEYSIQALDEYLKSADPAAPQAVGQLSILPCDTPCITKKEVRSDARKFIRPRGLKTLIRNKIKTSGTSGQPLTMHQDYGAILKEEAFVYRQLRWAGYRHGDRKVWLRGDVVQSGGARDEVAGCRDWWTNTLFLSSYHISLKTTNGYLESIRRFDPVLIQAYPSSIHALASCMMESGIRYPRKKKLKGIVTSSETLTAEMQSKIEAAFGCPVFDWYGQVERVIAIGTCEHGSRHVISDYGRAELIPAENGLYELVGTGFNNGAMPLVRYRTEDHVELQSGTCRCNRVFPMVKRVVGRSDEIIVLSDGRQIASLGLIFKGMNNIVQGQVVYRGGDCFTLRVVPGPGWGEMDAERLCRNMKERVDHITVSIELLDAIPRGANGKMKFVVREDH
jgi:phenylacetate-CoA ligase